jgi:hypothetical protein
VKRSAPLKRTKLKRSMRKRHRLVGTWGGKPLATDRVVSATLTPTERRFLDVVARLTSKQRRPPLYREVTAKMGWRSFGTVAEMIYVLRGKGRIAQSVLGERGIRLADACQSCGQPLL